MNKAEKTMTHARDHWGTIRSIRAELQHTADVNHIGLGELVHVFTDYLGIAQCAPCIKRQVKFDRVQIPTKFVWAELVNRAKLIRNPNQIQVTWIDGD